MLYGTIYVIVGILAVVAMCSRSRGTNPGVGVFSSLAAIGGVALALASVIGCLINNDVSDATAMLVIAAALVIATLVVWRFLSQF